MLGSKTLFSLLQGFLQNRNVDIEESARRGEQVGFEDDGEDSDSVSNQSSVYYDLRSYSTFLRSGSLPVRNNLLAKSLEMASTRMSVR